MTIRRLAAVLLLAGATALAHANEAEIRKAMQARFPGVPVESVVKTPFPGIFEVVVGGRVIYTDEKTTYVFIGTLLDTRTTARAQSHGRAHRAAHGRCAFQVHCVRHQARAR